MKNYITSIVLSFVFACSFGQDAVDTVHSDLGDLSLNVSSVNSTYNLEDLKYFANLASGIIDKVIISLESSRCKNALDFAKQISEIIDASLEAETHSVGRNTILKAKSLIAQTFYEYDACGFEKKGKGVLNELEKQQSLLKLQQIELELKAKQIKRQLEEQKEKEIFMEKKKFIDDNSVVDVASLKMYNERLESCKCDAVISDIETENLNKLTAKSLAEIKTYYLKRSITFTKLFLEKLKNCKD